MFILPSLLKGLLCARRCAGGCGKGEATKGTLHCPPELRSAGETVIAQDLARVVGLPRGKSSHTAACRAQQSPSVVGSMVAPHKDMSPEPVNVTLF